MMDSLMGLIGNLAQQQNQLPLQYGQMYQNAYAPGFNYFNNQAQNMTNLGGQSMGLYGNLAGQQSQMYQSELPFQRDMQMFNSIAPVLSGLLGQGGMSLPAFSPINMQFNRPDVMGGFQGVVDNAYKQTKGYDGAVGGMMADQMDKMPVAPYLQQPQQPPQPQPAIGSAMPGFGGQQPGFGGERPRTHTGQPVKRPVTFNQTR
jgi:hypothetical protein